MNPKAAFQYKMTVDYLKQMAAAGFLSDTELETAISFAKTRYQISETAVFALDIS